MTIQMINYVEYWKSRIQDEFDESTSQLIEKFINELAAADFAENTLQSYLTAIHMFISFAQKTISDISRDDMIAFMNHLKDNGKKLSTRRLYNRKIAKFFEWSSKIDLKIDFPKRTKEHKLPDWSDKLPTMAEIEQMLEVSDYPRDSALFAILVESGSRINEILRMQYKDVKVNDAYIRITLRARKSKRDIPIVWGSKYIMRWLDFHPTKKPDDVLWPRKYHYNYKEREIPRNIDYRGAYEILKRLKKRAGIKRKITPHLFRHLRATILAKDPRISTEIKKAYLGQSPLSNVFEKTYMHLSQQDVVDGVLHSFGLKEDKETPHIPELKGELCPRCSAPIIKNDKYCSQCWFILDQEEALKQVEEQKKSKEAIKQLIKILEQELGIEKLQEITKALLD